MAMVSCGLSKPFGLLKFGSTSLLLEFDSRSMATIGNVCKLEVSLGWLVELADPALFIPKLGRRFASGSEFMFGLEGMT